MNKEQWFDRNRHWAVGVAKAENKKYKFAKIENIFSDGVIIVEPYVYIKEKNIPEFVYRPYFFVGVRKEEYFDRMRMEIPLYFLLDRYNRCSILTNEELDNIEGGLIRYENKPKPLSDLHSYIEGDKVKVKKGNFGGFKGVVKKVEDTRCVVNLDDFDIDFTISYTQLEKRIEE